MKRLLFILIFAIPFLSFSQIDIEYQEPPEEILALADAPPLPSTRIDDKGEWMLLLERSSFKTLAELAEEEYKLAGLRINPRTNGQSRARYNYGIEVKNIRTGDVVPAEGLPEDPLIGDLRWSHDQSMAAFTNTTGNGIELWLLDIESAVAKRLTGPVLNDVFWGAPYAWEKDDNSLLIKVLPEERGEFIEGVTIPEGPVVRENTGKESPVRTYQDLLKSKADEINFEYFATSQLARLDLEGNMEMITQPDMIRGMDISPDGNYIMLETINKPFSYLVPYSRFGYTVKIIDPEGNLVKKVIDYPVLDDLPKGFMSARKGPRNINWRNDMPASIYWAEALDGGDPDEEVDYRDAVYSAGYPFDLVNDYLVLKTRNRFRYIQWGPGGFAIAHDYWWNTRNTKVYMIDPGKDQPLPDIIFDLNTEDRYNDPGDFVMEKNEFDEYILAVGDGKWLYLEGEGYGPEGNRPFIDQYKIKNGKTNRLWQAAGENTYERIVDIIDIRKGEIITSIESPDDNPQLYIRNIVNRMAPMQITDFPHPYESLKGMKKEFVKYQRDDGVDLTATLYLPPGYDQERDGSLPMLMWAYPREYKDAASAGQVKTSPHRFTYLYYGSPIYWVMRGYAVMDRCDFPIIGEGDQEPNDTFIEQLVSNAKAAIDYAAARGIADPDRVAVGGHSYGAFMTANLLTHSDLFAAGIARSGAYNRTFTPFGFQAEERTYWEAPDIYYQMSPFMHADKMKTPLLLIHGEMDNNSGTFPIQSERYYHALKGHGATVRLVMLPYESHGYAARKNIMHMLWEQDEWLGRWMKVGDE
jgi:dipeptidyl aminopeptidase/acylaminoacyl peptidase